jgi:hypothetical protein
LVVGGARAEDDEDREAHWIPHQKGYGGSGAISDGRVVVWVVAADFLVIFNSLDWGFLTASPDGTFGPRMVLKMVLRRLK